MERRRRIAVVWLVAGLALAGLGALLARPMAVGWRCYALHVAGERATAVLVSKLDAARLVLRIEEGSGAGHACSTETSPAHHAALEPGAVLRVVHRPEAPGVCVLEATLENSLLMLVSLSAAAAGVALAILLVAAFVQRSLSTPGLPSTQLDASGKRLACPECGEEMAEGYLVVLAGLHWRRMGEAIGLPHALGGLPGTVGWRGRPRLHAFRCAACGVVTFKHSAAAPPC